MSASKYTPDMAASLRLPFEPRIAPDGRNVAFRVEPIGHGTKDRTSTIFVAATDGSAPPRAITGAESHNTDPAWSPDSQSIAFLSDRRERGTSQLHVIPASGGDALRLTDLKGGVSNVTWISDGRSLLFTARRMALVGEKDPDSEVKVASERWRPQAIARVPSTGGSPSLIGPAGGHVWTFAVSEDGHQIAAVTQTPRIWPDSGTTCA